MPTEPIELETRVVGLEQTVRELRKLVDGLEDVGDEADRAGKKGEASGGSWKKLQQDFFFLKENISAVATGVQQAVAVIQGLAAEYERTSRVLSAFSGDINEASERTQGLISNLDLMIARNRAAQAGVQLSAHDLANLAVKATQVAQATGEDATEAFNRLTEAVSKGEAEALREYGLRLDGLTDKSQVSAGALSQLETQVGSVDATAGGLGGTFTRVENAMSNATTEFVRGFDSVENLKTAFDQVGEAIGRVADAFGVDLSTGLDDFVMAGAAVAEVTATMAASFAHLAEAVANMANGDFEGAWREALAAQERVNEIAAGILAGQGPLISRIQDQLARGGRSGVGGKGPKDSLRTSILGTDEEEEGKKLPDWLLRQQSGRGGRAANDNKPGRGDGGKLADVKADLVAGVVAEQEAAAAAALEAQEKLNQAKLDAEAIDAKAREQFIRAIDKQNQGLEKSIELTEKQTAAIEKWGTVGQKAGELVVAAIQGEGVEALKNFLKQTAEQNAVWAAENIAKGTAAVFAAPHAAPGFFAAAAMHGAIAVAAGGASLALPSGGRGASDAATGGANRPLAESTGTTSSGPGTVVINMNIPNAHLTPEESGRAMYANMQAAKRAGYIPKAA